MNSETNKRLEQLISRVDLLFEALIRGFLFTVSMLKKARRGEKL
jgi:hypothetical protein